MKFPTNMETGRYLDQAGAATWMKTNGPTVRPDPPRNPQSQSGSRKILVTWDAPQNAQGIVGYRIYKGNESSVLDSIYDPNVRQYSVAVSAGSSPPLTNVFISSLSKRSESVKVQIQGKATAEAGAPADPAPPPDSSASGNTGKTLGTDGFDRTDQGPTR